MHGFFTVFCTGTIPFTMKYPLAVLRLLPGIVITLFLNACGNAGQADPAAASARKPNILFILVDDLGYSDLGFLGSSYYETPHLDRLAKDATVFTAGYATSRVCSPSRASLLTGQFPARHGITDWIGAYSGEDWRQAGRFSQLLPAPYTHSLDHSHTTLSEAFKEAGYSTFFAGKWHLGGEGSLPTDHGFDINRGGWEKGSPIGGYFAPWENPYLPYTYPGENLTRRLAEETASFLEAHRDSAFLAYLSFYAVHGPIQTTREKWRKYRDKAAARGIAETGFEMGRYLPVRQVQDNPVYGGLVESMDDAVGHVMDELERLGLAETTIVVFTSDNGGVVSGDSYSTSLKPLSGGKGYPLEGGIRVPLLIRIPSGILEAPSRIDIPVTGADLYPTLLELAGLPPKPLQHLDGVSLVSLLRQEPNKEWAKRPLIWHYPHYGNQGGEPSSVIRLGEWKLIDYYADGRQELFRPDDDLGETQDLSSTYPEVRDSLAGVLREYLKETGARFPMQDPLYDPGEEALFLEQIRLKLLPEKEAERLRLLEPDFTPDPTWWGSNPDG